MTHLQNVAKSRLKNLYGIEAKVHMEDEVEKGGEGSRGGKVIGHTKSGKAIYDSDSHIKHEREDLEHNVPLHHRENMESRKNTIQYQNEIAAHKESGKGKLSKMKSAEKKEYDNKLKDLRQKQQEHYGKYKADLFDHIKNNPTTQSPVEKQLLRAHKKLEQAHKNGEYSTMSAWEEEISRGEKIVNVERNLGKQYPGADKDGYHDALNPYGKFPHEHFENWKKEGDKHLDVAKLNDKQEKVINAIKLQSIAKENVNHSFVAGYARMMGVELPEADRDAIVNHFSKSKTTTANTEELIDEHEHLIEVLRSLSHEDDEKEADKQEEELEGYKQHLKKGNIYDHQLQQSTYLKGMNETFEKGGEGSRGGKIIGHTKTGKPVYANKDYHEYKDFSEKDHRDASKLHHEKKQEYTKGVSHGTTIKGEKMYKNQNWSKHHWGEHTHAQMAESIKNSENKEAINKVKEEAKKNRQTGDVHSNAHGYHHQAGGGVAEYDEKGNYKDTVPSSFYHPGNAHHKMHINVDKNDIEKGGFGSGRHRLSELNQKENSEIGKTKSGKTVYSHSNAMDYHDYSIQDHKDAVRHHMKEFDDPKNNDLMGNKKRHLVIAQTHANAAGILN